MKKKRKRPPVVKADDGQGERSRRKYRGADSAARKDTQLAPPFTAAGVQPILARILKKGQVMPSEVSIKKLATMLNNASMAVALARSYPPGDTRVRDAMELLVNFFEARRVQTQAVARR
jgi:hypothetical protein